MKFSTETLAQITALLISDFEGQLDGRSISIGIMEPGLREALQSIGQESFGQLLNMKDQQTMVYVASALAENKPDGFLFVKQKY